MGLKHKLKFFFERTFFYIWGIYKKNPYYNRIGKFTALYLKFLRYSRVAAFTIGFTSFSYLLLALQRSRAIALIIIEVSSPCRLPLVLWDLSFDVLLEIFKVTPQAAVDTTSVPAVWFFAVAWGLMLLALGLSLALGISWDCDCRKSLPRKWSWQCWKSWRCWKSLKISWFFFHWVGFCLNTVFLLVLPAITLGEPCCFLSFYLFSFPISFCIPQEHGLRLLYSLGQLMGFLLHFWRPLLLIFAPLTILCGLDRRGRSFYNYLLWKPLFDF